MKDDYLVDLDNQRRRWQELYENPVEEDYMVLGRLNSRWGTMVGWRGVCHIV